MTLIRLIFNLVSAGTHIKCAAGYLWSASVRSRDLDFSPQKNLNPYPAQLSVKGVCQGGSSVPLDRVLVPFTRVKGTPPRRAVLTMPLQKPPRRRQATANYPPPGRRTGYAFAKGFATPTGEMKFGMNGIAVRGCGTMFFRVVVPQRVTLPSLKFEQAVICPDGPSPATGEG